MLNKSILRLITTVNFILINLACLAIIVVAFLSLCCVVFERPLLPTEAGGGPWWVNLVSMLHYLQTLVAFVWNELDLLYPLDGYDILPKSYTIAFIHLFASLFPDYTVSAYHGYIILRNSGLFVHVLVCRPCDLVC